MGFFDDLSVNTLDQIKMIAGTEKTLEFLVTNSGTAMDLSGATCTWFLAPLGVPNFVTLSKSGSLAGSPNNQFNITLLSTDTSALSGKFIQQPVVTTVGGSQYRIGQGIITIIPAIA